jgi:opacity protein-like surface antigen
MKIVIGVLLLAGPVISAASAQRHEVAVLFGRFQPKDRVVTGEPGRDAAIASGFAVSVNYAVRLKQFRGASLWGEIPFVASPQHQLQSTNGALTRDLATLYLTPGVRIRLATAGRITPYLAAGAGYALFEQSTSRVDGLANMAPRHTHRAAIQFGGGVDVRIWKFLSLRAEARDFVSGNPAFNVDVRGGLQHNVLVAGGFVLRL